MNLSDLLTHLDANKDSAERLIGADWLQERGFPLEANFYRWVVAEELAPYNRPKGYYVWYSPFRVLDKWGHLHVIHFAKIPSKSIWRVLCSSHHHTSLGGISSSSRAIAFKRLRLAYLKVAHAKQDLYSNS